MKESAIIRIIKEDRMGGIRGNHGGEVKGTHNFDGEN
jgi:hypothetical protein